MSKVPLMVIPLENAVVLTAGFRGFTGKLAKLMPKLRVDLVETGLDVDADQYLGASILNSAATATLLFLMLLSSLLLLNAGLDRALWLSTASAAAIFLLFSAVLIAYPSILAGKKAELMERDLIYALKDMLLEVSSGASIYMALNGVAESDYGEVSKEFHKVVGKANAGVPVEDALEDLAVRTRSEHLKNSIWQIVNAIKSGSSVEGILRELVKDLTVERRNKIRNYSQELNVMVLIYMLFAVVIPTIATTLIIVLGPFMGMDMGPRIFYLVLPACFTVQIVLMEFIKSRRPVVYI